MQLKGPLYESQHGLHPLMTVYCSFFKKLVFVALPSGIVWVDVPSPSVFSGVANFDCMRRKLHDIAKV